jgi:hypothetical protein
MKQSLHSERAHKKLVGVLIIVGIIAVAAVVTGAAALSEPLNHTIPAPVATRTASLSVHSPTLTFPGISPPTRSSWGLPVITMKLSGTGSPQPVISEPRLSETTRITRANGSITPEGIVTVNYGSNKTYTITPNNGYHVADVLINGASIGAVTSYTFKNIHSNQTISATFAINRYTITPSAGYGGSISLQRPETLDYGSHQDVTIITDTGYHITNIIVDDRSLGAITDYSFSDIRSNHTIAATFAINKYTITASPGRGGTIAPSGETQVRYGSSQTFLITPDTGYHTDSVTVDGNALGVRSGYTFNNVVSPHTISATFVVDPEIMHHNPARAKSETVQPFIIMGTGFVQQGVTRVALYYPGTSTVFVEGELIRVISAREITGQFVLPKRPTQTYYDLRVTNPDGSSDTRPSGFEVT